MRDYHSAVRLESGIRLILAASLCKYQHIEYSRVLELSLVVAELVRD